MPTARLLFAAAVLIGTVSPESTYAEELPRLPGAGTSPSPLPSLQKKLVDVALWEAGLAPGKPLAQLTAELTQLLGSEMAEGDRRILVYSVFDRFSPFSHAVDFSREGNSAFATELVQQIHRKGVFRERDWASRAERLVTRAAEMKGVKGDAFPKRASTIELEYLDSATQKLDRYIHQGNMAPFSELVTDLFSMPRADAIDLLERAGLAAALTDTAGSDAQFGGRLATHLQGTDFNPIVLRKVARALREYYILRERGAE